MGVYAQLGGELGHRLYEHLGSYTGYHEWRCAVAHAAGFDLNKMEGYGSISYKTASADVLVPWTNEPFQLVLNNRDSECEYTVDMLPSLLKELEKIESLNVDDYEQSTKFIRVCEYALAHGETVVIC